MIYAPRCIKNNVIYCSYTIKLYAFINTNQLTRQFVVVIHGARIHAHTLRILSGACSIALCHDQKLQVLPLTWTNINICQPIMDLL